LTKTVKGKTLLNFGNDFQAIITEWKGAADQPNSLSVKMYHPLPNEVDLKTQAWIARELSPTVVDRVFMEFIPDPAPKIYLRPPNRNITLTGRTGVSIEGVNLSSLLSTSASAVVAASDPILEEWYSHDFNDSELNVDYADYREFIFFGSAVGRLDAFVQKLTTLESVNRIIALNSSSLLGTGSAYITGTLPYPVVKKLSDDRIDLLRSFDGYERFLYYESDIPYSSSLNTEDYEDAIFFNSDATWPKISGSIAPIASASAWYSAQRAIAAAYDIQNQNYLVNNIPEYLQSDEDSAEFLTFLELIGHQFDTLKIYIDKMPDIYNRESDPSIGMSPDIIWNVAQSFGIEMPNQYAIKSLVDYTIGTSSASSKIYRQVASETWKRFLHNQPLLMKSKGTKQALRTLANSYGILPTVLQIREGTTPGDTIPSGAFEEFEEQTNVLSYNSGAFIRLPWGSLSGALQPHTTELRFATTAATRSVLMQGDNVWAMTLEPISGSYGRVALRNTGSISVQTGALPLFSGDFFSSVVTFASGGMTLRVTQVEGDDLVEDSAVTESIPHVASKWWTPTTLNLGTSGSFFGTSFTGFIDEFRVWTETIDNNVVIQHAKYPGLYNGNVTTSSRDALLIRLSFNKPRNLGLTSTVLNESPFIRGANIPASLIAFSASNFTNVSVYPNNMSVITREVLRYSPNAGGSQFTTNKVIIADNPILKYLNTGTSASIPVLSPFQSIVPISDKIERGTPSNVVGFYFSLTDAINDSIIRSLGHVDLQNLIGDPADIYQDRYAALQILNNLYWDSYAYNYNINSFVDFVRNLLGPLFKQAKDLIPVRAKLLSGIVHEPHILERPKIKTKAIEISAGQYTRHSTDTYNLDAPALTSYPTDITGEVPTQDALYSLPDIYAVSGENTSYEGIIFPNDVIAPIGEFDSFEGSVPTSQSLQLSSEYDSFEGLAQFSDINTFSGLPLFFDDSTNIAAYKDSVLERFGVNSLAQLSTSQQAEYAALLQKFRSTSNVDIWQILQNSTNRVASLFESESVVNFPILPFSDFDKIESFNYFTDPNGFVGTFGLSPTRLNQNILTDRGIWTPGQVYSRNDFVLQSGSNGEAATGNDKEFVCITTDSSFASYIDPFLDSKNWQRVRYINSSVIEIRKAIVMNDAVTLAPSQSSRTPVIGYRPEHFKFSRDMRKGILNHQWLGCVQTNLTTFDGKEPVEITISSGERLFVHNPDAIQPTNDTRGPILDVQ
jgi:hypothetical protein